MTWTPRWVLHKVSSALQITLFTPVTRGYIQPLVSLQFTVSHSDWIWTRAYSHITIAIAITEKNLAFYSPLTTLFSSAHSQKCFWLNSITQTKIHLLYPNMLKKCERPLQQLFFIPSQRNCNLFNEQTSAQKVTYFIFLHRQQLEPFHSEFLFIVSWKSCGGFTSSHKQIKHEKTQEMSFK